MRKGFKYFDKVFLINLDIREDRLLRRRAFFESNGVNDIVERYAAQRPNEIEYKNYVIGKTDKHTGKPISLGQYGCISSHLNIIKMAKANNWESILVLEDDVEFVNTEYKRFYDQIINAFERKEISVIDVWLSENVQSHHNCYCTYPISAIQENDFSDIHGGVVDYSWMVGKFNENTKHLK